MSGNKGRAMPDLVHGAWARRAATVGGSEPFETQHVVWLQAGACYADVRVPFHPAAEQRCFTGRSGWDADGYRWTHAIDLDPVNGDDVGSLCWEHGELVERGMFPTVDGDVEYVEWWVRLDGANGPFLAAEGPNGCLLRVGDHAISVVDDRGDGGAFAACYLTLAGGRWRPQASIGRCDKLPSPDRPPSEWRLVHTGTGEVVTA